MESARMLGSGNLVLTISSVKSKAYQDLVDGEQVAVSVHDGWTLLATNRSVLERLRAGSAAGRRPEAPVPPWDTPPALWFDLESGGKTVRNGLAVATLFQLSRSGRIEDPYVMWKQLTHILEPAHQLVLRAGPGAGGGVQLELTWGP